MTENEKNDFFYVCSLIEYIARKTKNHRGKIVQSIGEAGIEKLLKDAEVNHCLSFEQVSDEVIDYCQPAGGAERADGAFGGRPRLCAGDRARGHGRHRCRAADQRARPQRLSGRVNGTIENILRFALDIFSGK